MTTMAVGPRPHPRKLGSDGVRGSVAPLPTGPVDIVLADPPWSYRTGTTTPNRRIENQYRTMPLAEIGALPVGAVAARDALLLLWTPVPKLAEALIVVAAWGFDYRTAFAWVKPSIGPGYWCRQRVELLLVGVRGHFPHPAAALRADSVIFARRRGQSRKPEAVYAIVERSWPEARKLELFARGPVRDGWTTWGAEATP
jgi:N6-adenosine-specific RNA methylase IME4